MKHQTLKLQQTESRKYSYVDNYEYIEARWGDPLSLNSAEKQELEVK